MKYNFIQLNFKFIWALIIFLYTYLELNKFKYSEQYLIIYFYEKYKIELN